jgi:hypothetical protein
VERRGEAVSRSRRAAASLALALALAASLSAAGCASSKEFRWDVYDDVIYRGCAARDMDPADQARRLGEEVERASLQGVTAPPGVRAHLGLLYVQMGNGAGARQMFEEEKAAYPESAVFMDTLISRLGP